MEPIYSKQRAAFILLLFVLTTLACNKKTETKVICGPCPEYLTAVIPNLTFKIVDKVTGNNLFFGSQAKYKPGDLHFVHLVNGQEVSVFLRTDTVANDFNIATPVYNTADTITMQIGNLPKDEILFEMAVVGKCCPMIELAKVLFNGDVVYTSANATAVALLKK